MTRLIFLNILLMLLHVLDHAFGRHNTTLIPIKNNCTENVITKLNKLRTLLDQYQSFDPVINRPISPVCLLPDYEFKYHFIPNFYCDTMIEPLICNRTNDLNYLNALYNSSNGDQWNNSKHWTNKSVDYCQRHGIFCCNTSQSHPCLNMIRLSENNLKGSLPSFRKYLKYSSVLTYIDLRHNLINGTIPDYSEIIPNLSYLKITHFTGAPQIKSNTLTGTLPSKWPNSNCTFLFDLHFNPFLSGTIPQWNSQKYFALFGAASTNFSGTIPNWNQWIWPLQIWISPGFLHGTIPSFSSTVCPLLEQFQLYHQKLTGSVPALPGQTPGASIRLHNNSLSGVFPWYSINYASKIELQDNDFYGEIILSKKVRFIVGINVTHNKFNSRLPCFYHNLNMVLIDARFNEFTSFQDCKGWPISLKTVLLSNNKINYNFDKFTTGLTNLSVIDFGNNQLKGTVSDNIIDGNIDGIYVSFYDNDLSCHFPESKRKFNDSWMYIGNDMFSPFVEYTNQFEKGLGIIAIVPKYELYEYLIAPLVIGCVTCIVYIFLKKWEKIRLKINVDVKFKPFVQLPTKDRILYIMQIATKYMSLLSGISIIMVIIYIKGAGYISCGYLSLYLTLTYLGTQTSKGYDTYSWISLFLFAIYSIICTLLSTQLIQLSSKFEIKPQQSGSLSKQELSFSNENRVHVVNESSMIIQVIQPVNISFCDKIQWCIKFIGTVVIFFCFLFIPIIVYSAYHAIPSSHTTIATINNNYYLQFIILYFVPIILATGKFFGVPYTINKLLIMLEQIGVNSKYRKNTFRNHLIQCIRFMNLILIPIFILFIFDDKCFKQWKLFWEYCGNEETASCIELKGSGVPDYNEGFPAWVCHDMCDTTQIVAHRCTRRFFEVLGPLYIFKMNIAMWFPLFYYMKQNEYVMWKFRNYRNKICCCYKNRQNGDQNALGNGPKRKIIEMDTEYMSLISSLEIIIVFGWALPLLVPLYSITIFGYWCVFSYGMHKYDNLLFTKLKQTKSIKPVSNWLCLSLMMQHVLAFSFYYTTQSANHGYCCVFIAVFNIVVFVICFYRRPCLILLYL